MALQAHLVAFLTNLVVTHSNSTEGYVNPFPNKIIPNVFYAKSSFEYINHVKKDLPVKIQTFYLLSPLLAKISPM